jgi:hypothetical protein
MAVLRRELPAARDEALVRQVASLEKDLHFMSQRLDKVTAQLSDLERRFNALTRSHMNKLGTPKETT